MAYEPAGLTGMHHRFILTDILSPFRFGLHIFCNQSLSPYFFVIPSLLLDFVLNFVVANYKVKDERNSNSQCR